MRRVWVVPIVALVGCVLGLAAVACGDDGSVAEEASAIPIDPVAGGNPTSMQVLSESHGWIARDERL